MEQVLYELPEGWRYESLGKLTHIVGGATPAKNQATYWGGQIKWASVRDLHSEELLNTEFKITEEGLKNSSTNIIPPETVVISTRVGLGKVVITKDSVAINQDLKGLLIKGDIEVRYLFYWLKSQAEYIKSVGTGATVKGVKLDFIKNLSCPLPKLNEQKRIVEKLDALLTRIDTAIEHLQESITLADSLYASSLDQVFEEVYKSYQTKCLSSLTTKIGSGATPKGGQKAYKDSGISLIRSLNVYDSVFKPEGLAFIDNNQASKLSNVEVETGDVLLNITGASIARCCIAPDDLLPARVNQHVCIIRPNELLDSQYLNFLLVSPKFKSALLFQGAGGATRQALTKAMISNLEIPLPPLNVQLELVGKVQALGEKHRLLKAQFSFKVSDLINLKSSILDAAFKGGL